MKRLNLIFMLAFFAAVACFAISCDDSSDSLSDGDEQTDDQSDEDADDKDDDDEEGDEDGGSEGEDSTVISKISSIPMPPAGQRWVVNEEHSDEFEGAALNTEKWSTTFPWWSGREPGLFVADNVTVEDGCMVLRGEMMADNDPNKTDSWYISCAAVVSQNQTAHYGYYECRMKANETTLSSTFWLSTSSGLFNCDGTSSSSYANEAQPTSAGFAAGSKFSQELDICECIGRSGTFDGSYFSLGMNSNMHLWYYPGDGTTVDIRAEESRLTNSDGSTPADDFNTYGCWWRDKSNISFYLNNDQQTDRSLNGWGFTSSWGDYATEFYYTEPMRVNMVVETYPYPWIELPTAEELADVTKNRTYYDWVRAYVLVGEDELTSESAADMSMFEENVDIEATVSGDKITVELQYTAPTDRNIILVAYNSSDEEVARHEMSAYAGYANITPFDMTITSGETASTLIAYIGMMSGSDLIEESMDSEKIAL